MSTIPLFLAIAFSLQAEAAPANPCRNGSFEELAPNGFPADWFPLGNVKASSDDVRSGERSLRLVRATEPPSVETGVNGRNIDRLEGGMDFHYKAVSARDVVLRMYVIPIGAGGIEN